eukprot:Gb_03752 [translate_table: standard]
MTTDLSRHGNGETSNLLHGQGWNELLKQSKNVEAIVNGCDHKHDDIRRRWSGRTIESLIRDQISGGQATFPDAHPQASTRAEVSSLKTTPNHPLWNRVQEQNEALGHSLPNVFQEMTVPNDFHVPKELLPGSLSHIKGQGILNVETGTPAAKIWACVALGDISKITSRSNREQAYQESSPTYKLHKGRCSLQACIVEAGMIPNPVEALRDQNTEVSLARLKALETLLLEESMLENGLKIY